MIFEYFDTQTINNQEVIDVWKTYTLNIETTNFQYHDIVEMDTLMSISFRYYDTIDNWWVIYLFNELKDINFAITTDNTINRTVQGILSDLNNINTISNRARLKVRELVREFYLTTNTIQESIVLANDNIALLEPVFLYDFESYLRNTIIEASPTVEKLKIPASVVVFDIKNEFERLAVIWQQNNQAS